MRSVFSVKGISEICFCCFLQNFLLQSTGNFFFLNNLVPNSEGQLYADKPESQANLAPILAIQGYLRLKN
jgi:hypothetical protein